MAEAASEIASRITEVTQKKTDAENIQKRTNSFLELAVRVDKQVANAVSANREAFYQVNPWLRPPVPESEKSWLEQAWGWVCGKGEAIVNGVKEAWDWATDTIGKICNSIVEFCCEHWQQILQTVLIVIGAVAAIAAVVTTGGLALASLLGAIGFSASTAAAISGAVAVVAVVSMVGSSTLNIIDTWFEIDNPLFNAVQKGLNIVSTVSNLAYSVGMIYNSFKGINPKDYFRPSESAERLIPGEPGVVTGGDSQQLGKNMMESMDMSRNTKWTGHQAQHVIPAEMKDHAVIQKIGMNMDDASNGMFLRTPGNDVSVMARHSGYHSTYNANLSRHSLIK